MNNIEYQRSLQKFYTPTHPVLWDIIGQWLLDNKAGKVGPKTSSVRKIVTTYIQRHNLT